MGLFPAMTGPPVRPRIWSPTCSVGLGRSQKTGPELATETRKMQTGRAQCHEHKDTPLASESPPKRQLDGKTEQEALRSSTIRKAGRPQPG